jgi:L-asparaginase/Glu-tRNA(Gln) amidotransferase subunit D
MRNILAAALPGFACLIAASAFADDTKPVVEFFATGGTIAMKIDPIKHAPVPAHLWRGAPRHRAGRHQIRQGRGEQPFERPL